MAAALGLVLYARTQALPCALSWRLRAKNANNSVLKSTGAISSVLRRDAAVVYETRNCASAHANQATQHKELQQLRTNGLSGGLPALAGNAQTQSTTHYHRRARHCVQRQLVGFCTQAGFCNTHHLFIGGVVPSWHSIRPTPLQQKVELRKLSKN